MDYRLFAIKDNAQGILDASISNSVTSVLLQTGDGAKFPSPIKGAATSAGNATTLNSSGIMAAGVQVGDHIYNITDGSFATVRVVSTNQVLTTDLEGGSGNTWDDDDEWVVNAFVMTAVQYQDKTDPTSEIVKTEKLLVIGRSTDLLTVDDNGRGFDSSAATSFEAGDSVYLLFKTKEIEELQKAVRRFEVENYARKADIADRALDSAVVKLTGNQTIEGTKTFDEIPILPSSNPISDDESVRKRYADDISQGSYFGILGEDATAGHILSCQPIKLEHFAVLTDTDNNNWRIGEVSGTAKIGIRVPVTRDVSISTINIRLKKVGSPGDNVSLDIQADNAGSPSGVSLGTSGNLAGGSVASSYGNHTMTFSSPPSISLSGDPVKFIWIIFQRSGGPDGSNYYQMAVNAQLGAAQYRFGTNNTNSYKKWNGSAWSSLNGSHSGNFPYFWGTNFGETYLKASASHACTANGTLVSATQNGSGGDQILLNPQVGGDLSSLEAGETYYLSTTAGEVVAKASAPSVEYGANTFRRKVGVARSSNKIKFERGSVIVLDVISNITDTEVKKYVLFGSPKIIRVKGSHQKSAKGIMTDGAGIGSFAQNLGSTEDPTATLVQATSTTGLVYNGNDGSNNWSASVSSSKGGLQLTLTETGTVGGFYATVEIEME